jgi:hypothetical protein
VTFEIQRFKLSVSCFSSTCRYITVHVPCGIAIQTSPVGLHLEGWGVRMRDLKGPKMNLFNQKVLGKNTGKNMKKYGKTKIK